LETTNIIAGDFGPVTVTLAGTRYQLQRISGELKIDLGSAGFLALPFQDADSFLQVLFGSSPGSVNLPEFPSWSSASGLVLSGSAGKHFVLPANTNIGLVTLRSLEFDFEPQGIGFQLLAGASGTGTLGPLQLTFQNVGLRVTLQSGSSPGQLQLSVDYLPPTGLGLSISAGPITSGGFLACDVPNGRYSAAISISLFGISVTGFALIDTRLPGGARGFSFLVLVFANFESIGGIQLGLGFVLTGVGGAFGIFRGVNKDALRSVVLSGNLNHLLFPDNLIQNAPAIISDLGNIFPPANDEYIFGPFARLGWGTPVIVEAELGMVLDVPRFVIALFGGAALYLPVKPAAVVEVHGDLDGALDPGQNKLEFTTTVHDSRILTYTLSGQMEFLLLWGSQPNFIFSLGGFNPHYVPPPGVPSLARMRLDLGFGDNPRISMQNYLAVTSNTLQFGALSELYASEGPFNVHGWIGFDALFQLVPLYFIVDFSAGIDFREGDTVLAGVHLSATLSGPSPWHAEGIASISVLFLSASVSFSATIGGSKPSSAPPAPDPAIPLAAAVANVANWSSILPPSGAEPGVISQAAKNAGLLLDPVGGASFVQRVLPLNKAITRFAANELPAPVDFILGSVSSGGVVLTNMAVLRDNFAVAQFEDLTDDQKLSQPSFTPMDAGFSVASNIALAANSQPGSLDYYTDYFEPAPLSIFVLPAGMLSQFTRLSPSAVLGASAIGLKRYAFSPTQARAVALEPITYVVVSTFDLSVRHDITAPVSRNSAYQAMNAYVALNPETVSTLQIMPTYQVAT
jgi:hypothetical protein